MTKQKSFFHISHSTETRLGIFIIALLVISWGVYKIEHTVSSTPAISVPAPIALPITGTQAASVVPAVSVIQAVSQKEIVYADKTKKQVVFTFDGGAGAQSTEEILRILAKHHVKGTFFLTGKFIETYPALVKSIRQAGHEIFNHTYSHPYLTKSSDENIGIELRTMEQRLKDVIGISPKPYFRPPYGDRDARVLAAAFKEGYQSVYWSTDALDWKETSGITGAEVTKRILSNLTPGAIYLMHLGDTITGAILDDVFTVIESKGYAIVSLTEAL